MSSWAHARTPYVQAFGQFRADQARSCAYKLRNSGAREAQKAKQDSRRTEALASMERTALIFRALIAADDENKFHRNHGQLAFVLKDKRPPDWPAAAAEFTRAISIRGDARTQGY